MNEPCFTYFQDEPDRIQKNNLAKALGYQHIVEKHQDDILRFIGRRGLARHYVNLALFFDGAGEFRRCRTCAQKALVTDDRDATILLLAFLTLFGQRVLDLRKPIRFIKKRITDILAQI